MKGKHKTDQVKNIPRPIDRRADKQTNHIWMSGHVCGRMGFIERNKTVLQELNYVIKDDPKKHG